MTPEVGTRHGEQPVTGTVGAMTETPDLPRYTALVALPGVTDLTACVDALGGMSGARTEQEPSPTTAGTPEAGVPGTATVRVGSMARYQLLGSMFAKNTPAPVTVRLSTDGRTTTALIAPRTRLWLSPARLVADHYRRTALSVTDALAPLCPPETGGPAVWMRTRATRGEAAGFWGLVAALILGVFVVVRVLLGLIDDFPSGTDLAVSVIGWVIGFGLVAGIWFAVARPPTSVTTERLR